MPRFYFHTEDGDSYIDEEGMDLPDLGTAKLHAVVTMGELLRDCATGFWDHRALKLIVTDATGLILFVLDLSAVEAPAIRRRA